MADQIFHITGRVIHEDSRNGLPGLRVEAWDKDLLVDDLVGSTETDAEGGFRIQFEASYFRELFLDRKPDLYFRVYQRDQLVKSTKEEVLWNVSSPQDILITVKIDEDTDMEDENDVDNPSQEDGTMKDEDRDKFKAHLDTLRNEALAFSDPSLIALLDAASERYVQIQDPDGAGPALQPAAVVSNLQEIGNDMVNRLQSLGVAKDKRTEIRQILSAVGIATPACW